MDSIAAPTAGEQPAAEREPPRHLLSNNWRTPNASPKAGNTQGRNQRSWDNRRPGNDGRQNNSGRRDDWGSRRESARNDSPGIADTDALSEGRRIYVGNLFYHVRPEQVTTAFNENGFGQVENVHISVDPMTGRNPGYCFVEFETREAAEAAIEGMSGVEIEGRSLKTGPCQPKQRRQARTGFSRADESYKPTFERWGNWTGDGGEVKTNGQGPVGAETHLREVADDNQRCRVFVGGLGKMIDQEENDKELRTIFKDFNVLVSPRSAR
jgi:RNA recognition motif-containing protein